MKKSLTKNILLAFFALLTIAAHAKDVFVKPNASGSGISWADAANISYISGSAVTDGDVVHIAEGEYTRSTQLTISKYITIIGGYSNVSTGTDLNMREIDLYKTIFKQEAGFTARAININISTYPVNTKLILDGLHFENFTGTAQGAAITIASAQGDIELKNLRFKNNIVNNTIGGALAMQTPYAAENTITIDGCIFEGNRSNFTTGNGYGGAIYFNNGTSHKTINIKNSLFKDNYAYARGAVGYFGTNLTVNVSDCTFDTNQCTATADNFSNGGVFYIVGAAGYGSTFNIDRSVFLNSYVTGKGSVIWFNNTSGSLVNYLNMNQSSMLGNYSSRTTSSRAAIDVDNYSTQLQFLVKNSVLSNYNNIGQVKSSRYADVMFVSLANSSSDCKFENSILNGSYFSTGNVLASITPPDTLYNKERGYLSDSTIQLALAGDLRITEKIVMRKTFTPAMAGQWIHNEVFDTKKKLNIPMLLQAQIPAGYQLEVNGQNYFGNKENIQIQASSENPNIALRLLSSASKNKLNLANISASNGKIRIHNIDANSWITVYNKTGQTLMTQKAIGNSHEFEYRGFVLVKISNAQGTQSYKVISQ